MLPTSMTDRFQKLKRCTIRDSERPLLSNFGTTKDIHAIILEISWLVKLGTPRTWYTLSPGHPHRWITLEVVTVHTAYWVGNYFREQFFDAFCGGVMEIVHTKLTFFEVQTSHAFHEHDNAPLEPGPAIPVIAVVMSLFARLSWCR